MVENFGVKDYFEIKYIDINDENSGHGEKIATMFGYDEDEVRESFIGANLKQETSKVINEPNVVITSIKRIGNKNLV